MTPKEKFEDIDMSKLPSAATEKLEIVKPYLFDKKYQTDEYKEDRADAAEKMNTLYGLIAQKYPESIKSKAAKAPEPKTPAAMAKQAAQQTVKQPKGKRTKATAGPTKRGNITVLAKEIRKEGESWNDARKRAAAMINAEKKVVVKKANKQYQKLKAYLAKHPIRKGATDLERDAPRKALPIGKRVAKKSGKTYYEYRENRTDRRRSGFPYLRLGGKLHGAGQFAKGGEMGDDEIFEFVILVHSPSGDHKYTVLANDGVQAFHKAKRLFEKENPQYKGHIGHIDMSMLDKYAKGGKMDDYTKSFGLVKVKFENPRYNYETSVSGDITEAQARKYFVGKMFDVGVYPNENMQKVIDIEFHPKGTYAKGGIVIEPYRVVVAQRADKEAEEFFKKHKIKYSFVHENNVGGLNISVYDITPHTKVTHKEFMNTLKKAPFSFEGIYSDVNNYTYENEYAKGGTAKKKSSYAEGGMIDLFEDYENIPPNVQEILDKYEDAFMDGDYKGLHEALKEVEKKGYTFEYYLDGQAYGLRPIDVPLNKLKGYEEFAKGGKIGFEGLSKKVAARYKGKSVPAKYRKEYGKTYDAAEAKEVGNKVAAKVYRQQLAKK